MDNSLISSKQDIIGKINFFLKDDSLTSDCTIQGIFSRVFVKYNQYVHDVNSHNFRKHRLTKFPLVEEKKEKDEENIESDKDYTEQDITVQEEFDKYWSKHGEDIILNLWVEKYRDFVDPTYAANDTGISDEKVTLDSKPLSCTNSPKLDFNKQHKNRTPSSNKEYDREIKAETSQTKSEDITDPNLSLFNSADPVKSNERAKSEDYNQQWDQLWQNHCIEVYNHHSEQFRQDWFKNLSETLDIVNSTTGLEYFELVKQEVLEITENRKKNLGTEKEKVNKTVSENASGNEIQQEKIIKPQYKSGNRPLGPLLGFVEEVAKKYEEFDCQQPKNNNTKNGEIINNGVRDTQESVIKVIKSEENINQDFEKLILEPESLNNSKEENQSKVSGQIESKDVIDLADTQNCVENFKDHVNNTYDERKESYLNKVHSCLNSDQDSCEGTLEEVDIEEAITEDPSSYNPYADKPNYLLNKLGLHFGRASGETEDKDLENILPYDKGETEQEVFFKSQHLVLFVSKAKFHKLNHRLKIDTRDMNSGDDGFEEMREDNIDKNGFAMEERKPANKHIRFKYSDDEMNENVKKEDFEKPLRQDILNERVKFFVKQDRRPLKQRGKVAQRAKACPSTMEKFSPSAKRKLSDENPDEMDINKHKATGNTTNGTVKTPDKQADPFSPEIKSFNFNQPPNSLPNESSSPVFVFKASQENSIHESNFPHTARDFSSDDDSDCSNLSHGSHKHLVDEGNRHMRPASNFDEDSFPFRKNARDGTDEKNVLDSKYLTEQDSYPTPRRRKNRRHKRKEEAPDDLGENVPEEILNNRYLNKYYLQRYLYWSRYDEGIQMDEESWYSVTPEKVAQHIASRVSPDDVVVDAFCGCGGNTIQFALACRKVISIDIDPNKIRLAQHNASVYKVSHKIQFIQGDFFALASQLKADVVFLSPPWGGPAYARTSFNIDNIFPELGGGKALYEIAATISPNIGYYLPRTTDVFQLIPLAGAGSTCEVEQNFVGRKFVAMTAYYGSLVRRKVKKRRKKKIDANNEHGGKTDVDTEHEEHGHRKKEDEDGNEGEEEKEEEDRCE